MAIFDFEYHKGLLEKSRRQYYARKVALAENADLSAEAKARALENAGRDYENSMRLIRALLVPEIEEAKQEIEKMGRDGVKRQLLELYEQAQKQGPAAVAVAAKLVEINGPEQLLALHATEEPLIGGFIALSMGRRMADDTNIQQKTAWTVLQSEVETRQTAGVESARAELQQAENLLSDVDAGPMAHAARIARLSNTATDAVDLRSFASLADAEIMAAQREVPKLL